MIMGVINLQYSSKKYRYEHYFIKSAKWEVEVYVFSQSDRTNITYVYLYNDTSQYLPKTVLYFCKRTVLKVLCYQNIYAEKHGEIG